MVNRDGLATVATGWVTSGPLRLYYEQVGNGPHLVLLHPGFGTIDSAFGELRARLARRWTVTAVEQQAHGHTGDIDRPLSYEQMVIDTATAMQALEIANADLFGWSDGGIVALGLASRHRHLVRRVAIIGAGYNGDAETPEFRDKMAALEPDNSNLAPFRQAYEKVSPTPDGWPTLVAKVKAMYAGFKGWSAEEIAGIAAPLMVMLGDRDFVPGTCDRTVPDGGARPPGRPAGERSWRADRPDRLGGNDAGGFPGGGMSG